MSRSACLSTMLVGGVALGLSSCADDGFTQPTLVEERGPFAVSGIVMEVTAQGVRPSVGATVHPVIRELGGHDYWQAHGGHSVITDAQGRYQLSGLPDGGTVQLRVSKPGYYQQCATPEVTVASDLSLFDGQLVASEALSASPSSIPVQRLGYRFVAGTIYDRRLEPVTGREVGYYASDNSFAAFTRTDSNGRYLLCGIPERSLAGIGGEGLDVGLGVPPGPSALNADLILWWP